MMENCKRQSDKNIFVIIWTWTWLLMVVMVFNLCHYQADAHFIQIEHNEFRASGYPRPALPPPLPHVEQHLPAKELTPVEFMVDLTNDLTYRILHYHSILNRNNFAFSPTALMSILVALYEGAAGRSALELKNVLKFPNNKDILRVGYRDIHRRLRTYFFGSENPLKGLSLNKDNITISRDYETILMFYGYDLGMDMVSSIATTIATPSTSEMSAATTMSTTSTAETSATPSTTKETTTMAIPETEETTLPTTTTEKETTTIETTIAETTTTTTEKPTTEAPTTTEEPTTKAAETTETPTTTAATETEVEATTGEEAAELISAPGTGEPFLRIQQKVRATHLPSGRLQAPPRPQATTRPKAQTRTQATASAQLRSKMSTSMRLTDAQTSTVPIPKNDYLPATSRTFQSERLTIRQGRQKRHLLGSFKEADANLFVTLFQQPPPPHHHLYTLSGPGSGPAFTPVTNEFEVEVEPQFITGPSSVGGGPPTETKQNYNTDIISHIFYLGSQEVIYTTYKVYNAVLYYKYFEHLKMSVLELELDTPEYNLMILLPDYNTDLVTAAASLHLGPTLRLLRQQLKPRWVQAIIPDFKLHGSMFLTNDLQNLGICDIFEPNRADFRPMTDEKGIYVKHIEQSINVNIRTHPINQLRRNYGAAQLHPIQISVNHPFLFFVIDRDLDVAVMAGRILNPLNVRIQ